MGYPKDDRDQNHLSNLVMKNPKFGEERARDALAFDPLPSAAWLTITDKRIAIHVKYSERLSGLLRKLPNAKWDADGKCWRYPFSSADAIREQFAEIDRLASLAQQSADKENQKRKAEKERITKSREDERQAQEHRRAMAQPRPMQSQYLEAIADKPKFALRLEAIGDNLKSLGPIAGFKSRCWVARIFGSNGQNGWARAFITGYRDYSAANSIGSRGIYITYLLDEGPIYEVSARQSWRSTDRYFIRIIDGQPQRMSRGEVEQCLAR